MPAKGTSRRPLAERFWKKVDRDGPISVTAGGQCWVWTGHCDRNGYGMALPDNTGRRRAVAHRVAWQLSRTDIPDGLYVCHRCDHPPCVNPAHLFLGTQSDNLRDMAAKGRGFGWKSAVTHCPQGHPYTPANTYVHHGKRGQQRMCRTCQAARSKVAAVKRRLQRAERWLLVL